VNRNATPGSIFDALRLGLPLQGVDFLAATAAAGAPWLVPEETPIIGFIEPTWHVFAVRRGGMGDVYLCVTRPGSRMPVALKSYSPRLYFDPVARRAFDRECALWTRLSAVLGVFPVGGSGFYDGRPFIRMQAVLPGPRGETDLRDLLNLGLLPLEEAVFYARSIATTLAEASELVPGLVHGDLKPENVLMVGGWPHITDFGLARCAAQTLGHDVLAGTDKYRSPEASDAKSVLTTAHDIFAFGVILTEMLDGRDSANEKPTGVTTQQLMASDGHLAKRSSTVRDSLLALARRCCAEKQEERPRSFEIIRAEIEQIAPNECWRVPESANAGFAYVIARAPVFALTRHFISGVLIDLKQYELALDFISSTDEESRDWNLWLHNGIAQTNLDRYDDAAVSLGNAFLASDISDEQQGEKILLAQASLLQQQGRYNDVRSILVGVAARTRSEEVAAIAIGNLGAAYAATGRYQIAERLLRRAIDIDQRDYVAWSNLAAVQQQLGRTRQATEALACAANYAPWSDKYHNWYGIFLMYGIGDVAAALRAFERAIGCGSTDPNIFRRAFACAYWLDHGQVVRQLEARASYAFGETETGTLKYAGYVTASILVRKLRFDGKGRRFRLIFDHLAIAQDIELADSRALEIGFVEPADDIDIVGSNLSPAYYNISERHGDIDPPFWEYLPHRPLMRKLSLTGPGRLVLDLYYPFDTDNYGSLFGVQYRATKFVYAAELGAELDNTAFSFIRCPGCSLEICTNRRISEIFVCHWCQHEISVAPLANSLVAHLGEQISAELSMDRLMKEPTESPL
jgi:serine/threonine protein kinase